jgi:hypothetical protein
MVDVSGIYSVPDHGATPNAWEGVVVNGGSSGRPAEVSVICADP